MHLYRSIESIFVAESGCVLTIGNFDGVHQGHQSIMKQLVHAGQQRKLPTVVMSFFPSPEEYFQGENAAPRLTTVSSRFFALEAESVDHLLLLPFNRALAQTSARDFVVHFLVERLNAKYILVGDDFRFGKNRTGDFAYLQSLADEFGFETARYDTVSKDDQRISSSRVRRCLAAGDLAQAEGLLGRRFTMVGRIAHGAKLGRQWGFPTLNIPVHHKLPCTGIFAVRVSGLGNRSIPGVANLGTRPMIDDNSALLEVHLFDYNKEIYGQRVCVEFVEKIRDEARFDSMQDLKMQIGRDSETARRILSVEDTGEQV